MNAEQQLLLARCYVALSEVDYDLAAWRREVDAAAPRTVDLRVGAANWRVRAWAT